MTSTATSAEAEAHDRDEAELPDRGSTPASQDPVRRRGPGARLVHRFFGVTLWQLLVIVAFVAAWQWLPQVPAMRSAFTFMDPFFISSPTRVAEKLWQVTTGADDTPTIWGAFAQTVLTAILGTVLASASGALCGLAVSNWERLNQISRPFVVVLNAIPRIAVIPIIVVILGSGVKANTVTAFTVVFFLVFYNALEGASSIPREMIQSARLLGASRLRIMWRVRWPYAFAWTMASLPNAIAFGLVGSVTAELFTGSGGIGYSLLQATSTADATLTMSVVVLLSFSGVVLVLLTQYARMKLFPWWESSGGA